MADQMTRLPSRSARDPLRRRQDADGRTAQQLITIIVIVMVALAVGTFALCATRYVG